MDEIGQILREARENKGLSLEEVQAATRINPRYLEALEEGDYEALPTPVHVKGFLRNYARHLGLEPEPLLDRYEAGLGRAPKPKPAPETPITPDNPLPIREDQPFFDPVNMEVEARSGWTGNGGSSGVLQLVIILALIVALGLVANRFIPLILGNGSNDNAASEISSAVRDVINDVTGATATPTPELVLQTEDSGGGVSGAAFGSGDDPVISTSRNNPQAAPTLTPTRPPLPATMDQVRLNLDILERTWLEVTIDGEVVYSGIARTNDTFEWTAEDEARLVTGNAIGVFATVNDVPLGRLGGRGERYEEVWQTTQ